MITRTSSRSAGTCAPRRAIGIRAWRLPQPLTEGTPERPFGWVHLALRLRRLKKFREAIRVLRHGIETCGETPTLLLSLACCHARVGSHSQAAKCLKRAFELTEDQQARNRLLFRAFDEPDLEPVWQSDPGSLAGIV